MRSLAARLSGICTTGYRAKDLRKVSRAAANKMIGRGCPGSSTAAYVAAAAELANCGRYEAADIVFVSVNGARPGRLDPDWVEIRLAAAAGVTFVTDGPHDRARRYNVGERAVADELSRLGYIEAERDGIWTKEQRK